MHSILDIPKLTDLRVTVKLKGAYISAVAVSLHAFQSFLWIKFPQVSQIIDAAHIQWFQFGTDVRDGIHKLLEQGHCQICLAEGKCSRVKQD
jgi:hypothetical protein